MFPIPRPGVAACAVAAACTLLLGAGPARAQVAMAGSYQNFDVLNNTGGEACGFEMEVWGVSAAQIFRIFPSNFNAGVIRYGFGRATDFPGGTYVRWTSPYDAASGRFTTCTPVPQNRSSVPGDSCWTIGMPGTYATAGCEHFGISANANPSRILYRWLVADPANPGQLMRAPQDLNLPAPVWTWVPPANPVLPPVIVAEVPAPPPPVPARFGDAQWVKVYKNERAQKVELEELVGDNPAVVPADAAHLEVGWDLLQQDPPDGGRQRRRGKLVNQGNLGNGNHAVVRRYEYYEYAGVYDPITHEALCADLTCTAPGPGELGNAIAAQNAAANLDVNALTVNVAGNGQVSSADKVYSCGNKCYGVYAPGSTVTLSAKPASGSVFSMWSGACAGNASTCTVTLNAEASVTASFVAQAAGGGGGGGGGGGAGGGGSTFTLSVAKSASGTVTSTPAGINCGGTCAARYAPGSAVTLVATPLPGQSFLGWSGACAGTQPSCTVTLNGDAKVTPSFTK